ncbi:checkpoint protein HUS1-like isoform X2 [Hydractinia symbiolongicarpus]|uniref:checkpoint protein HUS1-like isoform X2 n=1 Tax=Hydractinia symbiolongicarpus TaxID=13093 RepID=UPI00254C6E5A|nr:checkpoint protein HUS1-like isoform X2 [Hydractinia symbiolongicarpus]
MKFRAKLVDIGCIQQFIKILSTVSKICKSCTLRLSGGQVIFTQTERVASGGTNLWVEINQGDFFDEYRIEGKDDRNEIYLEVVNENLLRAMKSGQNAQSIKIKLTKKQTPCLTFEISLPSLTTHSRNVVHDVPVAVIPSRFWDDFQKPLLPNYDVISAKRNGELKFSVDTDEVIVTTHFKNMDVDGDTLRNASEDEEDDEIEARIDIQKLVTFLHVQQFNPTKAICALVHGQAVHMFLQCSDVMFQYFLPAMNVTIS